MKSKRTAAVLISAWVAASALHAQDQAPTSDADKKDTEKEVFSFPTLDLGWSSYGLGGLSHKYLQYATPPDGLFVSDFRYLTTDPLERDYGFVGFRGVPEQDSVLQAFYDRDYGRTVFEGIMTRSDFFGDTPVAIDGSRREIQEGMLRQKVGSFYVSYRYNNDQQDENFQPAQDPLHQRTRFWDLSGDGTFRGAQMGLGFSDTRFFDYTGLIPYSETERWDAHFARQFTGNLAIDGTYSQAQVSQPGLPGTNIESVNLGGDWDFGPSTFLVFNYQQQWLDLPAVQNAYDRRRIAGSAQLIENIDGWSMRLKYGHRDAERVEADHTFVDVPNWDSVEALAEKRIAQGLRVTVKGSYEHMSGNPVMDTQDPALLYWRNRSTAQMKLDRADDKSTEYASVSFKSLQNVQRDFELNTTDYLLGGTYEVGPYVEAFAEYSLEINQTGGGPVDSPSYSSFFPNGRVVTGGFSWSVRPSTSVTASFTGFSTANDNPLFLQDGNIAGEFLSISLKHRTKSGDEYGLTFAPWRYSDAVVSQMDYSANLFMLTASVKF